VSPLRTGKTVAKTPAARKMTASNYEVKPSVGSIPYSKLFSTRAEARASGMPTTTPATISAALSREEQFRYIALLRADGKPDANLRVRRERHTR